MIEPHLTKRNAALRTNLFKINDLTEREKEVLLHWVVDDYNYKEIASILTISKNTVRTHLQNINKKLNVSSKTMLIIMILSNV
ncbi:helix-turn-helix transcriptional regulator [Paenibacillus alba]|uniref:helix-turn-helix transcriptional regulator n=1 Tax=Paenibacillus alba TaxID=1197127 RepID=UPI00156690D4|nr:helix-turn-helix transcriptional regulator [Paenibacillus alba]